MSFKTNLKVCVERNQKSSEELFYLFKIYLGFGRYSLGVLCSGI